MVGHSEQHRCFQEFQLSQFSIATLQHLPAEMLKKVISFAGLKDVDVGGCVKKGEERSISDDTKKLYFSKLGVPELSR